MASPVAELRALAPHRPLPAWEARILAERQANKLLAVQGMSELPVTELLIEHLPRVEVIYRRSRSLSGSTKWTYGRWVIVVNANDTWGRQRFTLAHELKHVIDAPAERALYRDRSYVPAAVQRERAADYFAACLLMPRAWVKRAYCDDGLQDLARLARRFNVSKMAMQVRLLQIGLTEPAPRCAPRPQHRPPVRPGKAYEANAGLDALLEASPGFRTMFLERQATNAADVAAV